jgi:hypothetical protein
MAAPPPSNFPAYPVAQKERKAKGGRKKLLVGLAVAVVVLLGAGAAVFFATSKSTTTYTAEQCRQPGPPDDKGFTGCLRQLAGKVADTSQCGPGMGNGQIAPPAGENFGVSVTCSAPALAGAQVSYVHGFSAATLKEYTDRLLNSAGGDQVQAEWKGNGLAGRYSSAAGKASSVLVFTVSDRPLAGIVYQVNTTDQPAATTPSKLADYFEQNIQPGD